MGSENTIDLLLLLLLLKKKEKEREKENKGVANGREAHFIVRKGLGWLDIKRRELVFDKWMWNYW